MARIVLCVVATSSSSTNSKSNTKLMSTVPVSLVESSWNVMAHDDAREGKWRGNWRMEWVASTLHTTSEHGVSSISTADAHTSAASSRLNWRLRRLKWTRPFRTKDEIWFLRMCHHISNAVYRAAITCKANTTTKLNAHGHKCFLPTSWQHTRARHIVNYWWECGAANRAPNTKHAGYDATVLVIPSCPQLYLPLPEVVGLDILPRSMSCHTFGLKPTS
jgi:hypothetical protein